MTQARGRLAASRQAVEGVWRIEAARLIAGLARLTHDVDAAEDLAQDALVAALEQWPRDGIPRNPGAWLTTVAKRRAIDGWRRQERLDERHAAIARTLEQDAAVAAPEPDELTIDDDVLRLVFIACHPVLARDARVALTLRMVGGLSTEEIARAFLVPVPTLAQRIVRAKKALTAAQVPFELPPPAEVPGRLGSVLAVIYLIFNEGYTATSGGDWMRPALCAEALRLGRMLAALVPDEAEVHGLVALMELHASRTAARTSATGEPILLGDQDRTRWDRLQITRGLDSLRRSETLAQAAGPYRLQAAIAACHASAPSTEGTDWARIVALYDELAALYPSPVIQLNRAVALSMLPDAREQALAAVDGIVASGSLRGYHLLPAARADILERLGRAEDARAEFARAAALTENERERRILLERAGEH